MQNLGSIRPVVCEIQNKGNVCVGVYVCVCLIYLYKDGSGYDMVTPLSKALWYEQCNYIDKGDLRKSVTTELLAKTRHRLSAFRQYPI